LRAWKARRHGEHPLLVTRNGCSLRFDKCHRSPISEMSGLHLNPQCRLSVSQFSQSSVCQNSSNMGWLPTTVPHCATGFFALPACEAEARRAYRPEPHTTGVDPTTGSVDPAPKSTPPPLSRCVGAQCTLARDGHGPGPGGFGLGSSCQREEHARGRHRRSVALSRSLLVGNATGETVRIHATALSDLPGRYVDHRFRHGRRFGAPHTGVHR
jgi:hypothetical protein